MSPLFFLVILTFQMAFGSKDKSFHEKNILDQDQENRLKEIQLSLTDEVMIETLFDRLLINPLYKEAYRVNIKRDTGKCKAYLKTVRRFPEIIEETYGVLKTIAKDCLDALRKVYYCRTLECLRDLDNELIDVVDWIPIKLSPYLTEFKMGMYGLENMLRECLEDKNTTTVQKSPFSASEHDGSSPEEKKPHSSTKTASELEQEENYLDKIFGFSEDQLI